MLMTPIATKLCSIVETTFFGAHHAAVEERQPGRHQQHEAGGREHPGHVARVDRPAGHRLRAPDDTPRRAMLTAATSRNGSAENSRIRSVLLLTCANVIAPTLR